jgi:hypothetical protein
MLSLYLTALYRYPISAESYKKPYYMKIFCKIEYLFNLCKNFPIPDLWVLKGTGSDPGSGFATLQSFVDQHYFWSNVALK